MIKLEINSQYPSNHSTVKINHQKQDKNVREFQANLLMLEFPLDTELVYQSLHASQLASAHENQDENNIS